VPGASPLSLVIGKERVAIFSAFATEDFSAQVMDFFFFLPFEAITRRAAFLNPFFLISAPLPS